MFRDIVSRIWEGSMPLTHDALYKWMLNQSTIIVWKEGRENLREGLDLAYAFSEAIDA